MKYICMCLALIASTSLFASKATVINSTGTNINYQYLICDGDICNGSGGAHSAFIHESPQFNINLKSNQTVRIESATEIDYRSGYPVRDGANGRFDQSCKAYAGQKLRLWQYPSGRNKGNIICQVE